MPVVKVTAPKAKKLVAEPAPPNNAKVAKPFLSELALCSAFAFAASAALVF